MTEILLAFVTGLTTGGLSCLAVQGGLLASSMAQQLENDLGDRSNKNAKGGIHIAAPILWFLVAKLAAYTLLGFLLGWVGSLIQLAPLPRAILQIAIGIFMLGQALRILNVHPIFRWFNIEPPAFIRKYIRRQSKKGDDFSTPAFLGALTVLIPCGITQVMMASAMSTGDPFTGAALMFAFILGTSPVFFVVAYFATQLGSKIEKYFMKLVAVIVMILAIMTINTGLNLIGSPFSLNRIFQNPSEVNAQSNSLESASLLPVPLNQTNPAAGCNCGMMKNRNGSLGAGSIFTQPTQIPAPDTSATDSSEWNEVTVQVLNSSYSPDVVHIKADRPTHLKLESKDVFSCSLAFVIPTLGKQVILNPTDSQTIDLPAFSAGDQIPFSCSMGMYTGVILVE